MHMHVVHMDRCLHQTSTAGLLASSWGVMSVVQKALVYNIMKALCRSKRILKLCLRGSLIITATRIEQQCDVWDIHIHFKLQVTLVIGQIEQRQIGDDTVICQAIRAFKFYAFMMPFWLRTGTDKTLDSACKSGVCLVCMWAGPEWDGADCIASRSWFPTDIGCWRLSPWNAASLAYAWHSDLPGWLWFCPNCCSCVGAWA